MTVKTFHRTGGNANEDVISVRETYRQYFENVGSVPCSCTKTVNFSSSVTIGISLGRTQLQFSLTDTRCENSLRVTPHGSRKKPKLGRWPLLIHTWHAVPLPCCAVALSRLAEGPACMCELKQGRAVLFKWERHNLNV